MTEKPANPTISIPNWLNNDFFELHLKKYFNDQKLQIVGFGIQSASADDVDYYSCSMYRVNVVLNRQSENDMIHLSVILKLPVSNDVALAALVANNVYKKEIEFYDQIVPKINEALVQPYETKQLFAECYGVCLVNDVLLLEDLAAKSYHTSSVYRGYNFDEAKLILKKLASFHAINAVLQQNQPNIFENFKHGVMNRNTNVFDEFCLNQFDAMTESISTWPNANLYLPKFRKLRNNILERLRVAFDAEPNHFNTLIHGDLWTNNIMISHKSNQFDWQTRLIENIIFIDFQYACWTSPAMDLIYFLNTSLQESLRPRKFDDLIAYYHSHLETNLNRLEYKKSIPNLDEFKQQYHDKNFYGFVVSCMIQPTMINENTEKGNCETSISNDEHAQEFKQTMFSTPKIQANLQKLIPIYDEMGAFDYI